MDEKFTEEEIKKEWNALLTWYRKERQSEKASRSRIDDIYDSNWEHFNQMEFLETTPEANIALSTLDKSFEAKKIKIIDRKRCKSCFVYRPCKEF